MTGTLLVLAAYFAIVRLQYSPTSLTISCFNVVGSMMLGLAAIFLSNVGYILLNVVWIIIAVSGYRKARICRS
jgi:hypothetical protein